jgi:crotonobetainyl-CoA:carnitine CoA-transferase CaiB-like acyl-CoA transferase
VGWDDEPGWATLAGRLAAREQIDGRVGEWTRPRGAEEIAALLQAAGVSAMPVLDPDELRSDAHLLARGAIVTVEHPEIGPERHLANPLRMSRSALVPAGPAPLLGADTAAVLTEWLGLEGAEAQRLIDSGVCT